MPHALLLSPDDQAVSAITAVLEEMSVTCERPLDGISAAKKLNSNNFDLVLVDCENLPAAKLIFDVCRRGKGGNSPVPIAIVDGRAGLPTAFRLGAELILTKPVAKDQARTTIRTAVGRVKKEEAPRAAHSAEHASADATSGATEAATHKAGADTAESLLTHYEAPPQPGSQPAVQPRAMAAAASATSTPAAAHVPDTATSAPSPISASAAAVPLVPSAKVISMSAAASSEAVAEPPSAANPGNVLYESKVAPRSELSEDPVMAELERAEAEPASQPATAPETPVFSAYTEKSKRKSKARGPLVALLVLTALCGGGYAAWMYVPGFRTMAQPQVDRVMALAGMAHLQTSAPKAMPVKPVAPVAPAAPASAPAMGSQPGATDATTGANASGVATPASAPSMAQSSPATASPAQSLPAQSSSAQSATQSSTAPNAGAAAASATPTPSQTQSPAAASAAPAPAAVNKIDSKNAAGNAAADTKNTASASADDELPGEKTAVILSSKGAEKRLVHSVQPKYPAGARAAAEGTIVLKAVIDETGKVTGAKAVEGNQALADSAVRAVKQWRYRPYIRDGKAVPFQTIILIDFQRP